MSSLGPSCRKAGAYTGLHKQKKEESTNASSGIWNHIWSFADEVALNCVTALTDTFLVIGTEFTQNIRSLFHQ
jgi:hypothetical protein